MNLLSKNGNSTPTTKAARGSRSKQLTKANIDCPTLLTMVKVTRSKVVISLPSLAMGMTGRNLDIVTSNSSPISVNTHLARP